MRHIQRFLKRHFHFLLALALTLLCVAVTALVYDIRYEANDDAMLSNIASGAYGPDSQFLVYVNVLLGFLLKPLLRLGTTRNWFFLMCLAAAVLSIALLGRVLLDRAGRKWGCVAFVLLLLYIGVPFFAMFHYARYASLAVVAGIVLVWNSLGKWNGDTLLGLLLVCFGAMLRFEQYLVVGGLSMVPLAYTALTCPAGEKRRAVLAIAALVALPLGLRGADSLYYAARPEWKAYLAFNDARTEVLDYRKYYDFEDLRLADIGMTRNDYLVATKWIGYEPSFFTTERMWALASVMPESAAGSFTLAALGAWLVRFLFGGNLQLVHTAVLATAPFCIGKRRRVPALGVVCVHALMIAYLCWRGRYIPRVEEPMMLAATVFLLCCFGRFPLAGRRRRWMAAAAVALAAALAVPGLVRLYRAQEAHFERNEIREELAAHIAYRDDGLYLVNVLLLGDLNGYHVWRAKPPGYLDHIVFVGSWLMHSPLQDDILAAHGLTDPYRDSLDRDDVFWVEDFYQDMKQDFLREHYAPGARLELVAPDTIYSIYRAVSN